MTILFQAKTNEGHTIKVLIELLQRIVKSATFEINANGLFLRMVNNNNNILVNLALNASQFHLYEFNSVETLFLGLNTEHLYKMLKSIKKKDALKLCIDTEMPDHLKLIVIPQDNSKTSCSNIQIQNIQNVLVDLPEMYSTPVIISANEYQRTLKEMEMISKTLTLKVKKHSMVMFAESKNVFSRQVNLGEVQDETPVLYSNIYEMETLDKIKKISGLSKNLQIYGSSMGEPLKIQSSVGTIGTISFYIKAINEV